MCGIGGWIGREPEAPNVAGRLIQAMRHRGPDDSGIQRWHEAALVHTRLSILDLSPGGTQPMANEDGTVWTVFNGEIYNHQQLRRELEARGHRFAGRSDTEVLPHLYEEYGDRFADKLRGMFAVAIYDRKNQKMILARDRFGIKPLFYTPGTERLAFASEIPALLELPGVDARPDRQAVYDFAALFYIPAPETFYAGIRALEPGQILLAQLGNRGINWQIRAYHQWTISPDPKLNLSAAVDQADRLLTAAVRRQLESDVPLGTLLSGGIDSSLVSAAAQTALDKPVQTFNVRFAEQEYDETWAATEVARHIGSDHLTLDMNSRRGSWEYMTGLLLHAGQPYADTSLFATHAICRRMREHVTVALSGDGGDEGFGGYNFYWQIATAARMQKLPALAWRGGLLAMAPLSRLGVIPERLPRRVRELSLADDTSLLRSLLCWIGEEDHRRLCRDTKLLPIRRWFEPQWSYDFQPHAARLDRLSSHATEVNVRLILPNDFLFKVDTASMKEGLEVRVPMLDEDLFALGLSLPHHLKVSGRTGKRILRAIAERRLPRAVATKPKRGFAIPVDTWVGADFKQRLREALLGSSSDLPEFFRPEVYRPIVDSFCDGRSYPGVSRQGVYQTAMMLLSLQLALGRGRAAASRNGYETELAGAFGGLRSEASPVPS
jgi:asparagine synthase (glutamine-hydrolysing)